MFDKENKFVPFERKLYLSSPTMHGEEQKWVNEAIRTNWVSTVGENIDELEHMVCDKTGSNYAVALSCGTAALHMAVKLAGVKPGDQVFCSDMTFSATVNPVVYEGGIPVFIDSEYDTWNMDPRILEKAFEKYPNVKTVICANLYGTPAKLDELSEICGRHGAILIEDAAESLGAVFRGRPTGTFGTYNVVSFNGNKIITGSSGGMLLTDDANAVKKVRKWSTQSREHAPWYQHEELGYNYRMSNIIAGMVRGQFPYLEEHIAKKKAIYERYREGLRELPVTMNPYDIVNAEPNFWLSCLLVDKDAMCKQVRDDHEACYIKENGKSCPTEMLARLAEYNAEGRAIWKPMHLQPLFRGNLFVAGENGRKEGTNVECVCPDVGADIFTRGLCLPSDIKMTEEQQERIIAILRSCFA